MPKISEFPIQALFAILDVSVCEILVQWSKACSIIDDITNFTDRFSRENISKIYTPEGLYRTAPNLGRTSIIYRTPNSAL